MTRIPIVFAFDHNLIMAACVSIHSLLANAEPSTHYDIFILHSDKENISDGLLEKTVSKYPGNTLSFRTVGNEFDGAFEIRGITTAAYYRLLIPTVIPEYKQIIYADADIIFRQDLSDLYNLDLKDNYIGAVKDPGLNLTADGKAYISKHLNLRENEYVNSGFLLINSDLIRKHDLVTEFTKKAKFNWQYQDQDVLNLVCDGKIHYIKPKYNMMDYSFLFGLNEPDEWSKLYTIHDFQEGTSVGNIHYNGHKPWKKWSANFDIWWEYYRNSPVFNEKFYFDFFYNRINELDRLPLWKRIKILARWFLIR